jgi:hypothetical protein
MRRGTLACWWGLGGKVGWCPPSSCCRAPAPPRPAHSQEVSDAIKAGLEQVRPSRRGHTAAPSGLPTAPHGSRAAPGTRARRLAPACAPPTPTPLASHPRITPAHPPARPPLHAQRRVPVLQADGRSSPAQRERLLAALQAGEPGPGGVALLGLTSLGTGLTLGASSVVVFAELHPTPGVLLQVRNPVVWCCYLVVISLQPPCNLLVILFRRAVAGARGAAGRCMRAARAGVVVGLIGRARDALAWQLGLQRNAACGPAGGGPRAPHRPALQRQRVLPHGRGWVRGRALCAPRATQSHAASLLAHLPAPTGTYRHLPASIRGRPLAVLRSSGSPIHPRLSCILCGHARRQPGRRHLARRGGQAAGHGRRVGRHGRRGGRRWLRGGWRPGGGPDGGLGRRGAGRDVAGGGAGRGAGRGGGRRSCGGGGRAVWGRHLPACCHDMPRLSVPLHFLLDCRHRQETLAVAPGSFSVQGEPALAPATQPSGQNAAALGSAVVAHTGPVALASPAEQALAEAQAELARARHLAQAAQASGGCVHRW